MATRSRLLLGVNDMVGKKGKGILATKTMMPKKAHKDKVKKSKKAQKDKAKMPHLRFPMLGHGVQ